MKLLEDINSLNEIINNYYIKNTVTNNYLLLNSYSQYIAENKLFYITSDSNVCILVEKTDFYQLYYYINDLNEGITFDTDDPVMMEILYRGEAQKPNEIIRYWEKCGFKQYLTRDTMVASYNQINLATRNVSDVEIKYAETETEISYTKELIENTLDKYTGDILSKEEIYEFARNKNVLCAYWEGSLCGILQFEIKKTVVWLGHIAVDSGFRGKGIANELVKAYILNNATHQNTKYQLWVIQDNRKAMALYHKFGFIYGIKTSASMLKKKNNAV